MVVPLCQRNMQDHPEIRCGAFLWITLWNNVKNSLVFHSICVGGGMYVDEQIVNIRVSENEYIRMRPVDKTGYEKLQRGYNILRRVTKMVTKMVTNNRDCGENYR